MHMYMYTHLYMLLCNHVMCIGVAMLSRDAVTILTKAITTDLANHHIRISKN